jgi:spoIIIJ-associated protein
MQEIEVEGKDVQQAVEKGLKQMGLRRDQVEVAIKDEGSSGFLGLGARPARVIIRERKWVGEGGGSERREERRPSRDERPAQRDERRRDEPRRGERGGERGGERRQRQGRPPEGRERRQQQPQQQPQQPRREREEAPAARHEEHEEHGHRPDRDVVPPDTGACVTEARTVLTDLLKLMSLEVQELKGRWDSDQIRVHVDVESTDGQILIGKDGRSLEALQFLSTVLVSRRMKVPVAVQVDTAGYWKNREDKILGQVRQAADEVARTGRAFRLDPMDPATRRLVHKALQDHPGVETASEGEGPWRKVVLKPRRK